MEGGRGRPPLGGCGDDVLVLVAVGTRSRLGGGVRSSSRCVEGFSETPNRAKYMMGCVVDMLL